jgi:hypothetical protein
MYYNRKPGKTAKTSDRAAGCEDCGEHCKHRFLPSKRPNVKYLISERSDRFHLVDCGAERPVRCDRALYQEKADPG